MDSVPTIVRFDATSDWGRYRAQGVAAASLALVAKLPRSGLFRRLAFLLRKPVKSGQQELYDREIWGLRLRLSARGNLSEQRWLTMEQFHDWPEREALRDALDENGVLLDVGANVGFYTFWALAQRVPGLRVIAVEPSATMIERLRFNLKLNQFESAVRIFQCAVTPEPCEVVVAENACNLGQSSIRNDGKGERVPGRPMLDVVKDAGVARIDALKIDIEGHEVPVLEAFFRTATKTLWPRLIIGEIVGANGGAFQQMLASKGYNLERATKMNGIFRLARNEA
jgi:FkbM family methyltransferase